MNIKYFSFYALFLLLLTDANFASAQEPPQKMSKKETGILIDSLDLALNRWYIYPNQAATMTGIIRKNYKNGAYNNAQNKQELAMQLQQDLQQAHKDGHLNFRYDPQLADALARPVTDSDMQRDAEHQMKDAQENNFAFKKAEVLPGNIGYVKWDGFWNFVKEAQPTFSAAFRFVSNCKALIIDMRTNGGGAPPMVLFAQSYFFNQKTHMNDIIDRDNHTDERWTDPATTDLKLDMPVYILTSRGTFSGAEDFTYGLQCVKRAVVVGDTTGGGAHPTRPFIIGQGFIAEIPTHRSINSITGTDWEGTGVRPDVAVPADQALIKAQLLIFRELLSKTTDEDEKSRLQWGISSMENKALLAGQVKTGDIKLSKEDLLKYTGAYKAADPNSRVQTLTIVFNGSHLARHAGNGTEDVVLVPVAVNKFIYDDESGRSIDFATEQDGTANLTLCTQGGMFKLNKQIEH